MSYYKQPSVPVVDDKQFEGMALGKIKTYVSDFFDKNLRDTQVKNLHKGITIDMRKAGLRHVIHARNPGYVKMKAVMVVKEMLRNAVYCNFGEPDANDAANVMGYFNFKCKVNVEGKDHVFRIVVRLTTDGKFYYDHAVKVVK